MRSAAAWVVIDARIAGFIPRIEGRVKGLRGSLTASAWETLGVRPRSMTMTASTNASAEIAVMNNNALTIYGEPPVPSTIMPTAGRPTVRPIETPRGI